MLEGIAQRELHQPRRARCSHNFAEGTVSRARQVRLDVGYRGVGEVGVIPDVEEIGGEADLLALADVEILDQRRVPVLLERAAVKVATEVAEARGAEVGIACALRRIQQWRWREGCGIQVSIGYALMNITAGQDTGNGRARSEAGSEKRRTSLPQKRGARARIENREWKA